MAPPRIDVEHARDFTGGLNLAVDPVDLAPNETFDVANVDIGRRGGFGIRRGVRPWITTVTGFAAGVSADSMYTYRDPTLVRHLLVANNSHTRRWDGAAWQDVRTGVASSGTTQFTVMNGVLYFTNQTGGGGVHKWSGVGLATALAAPGYNDNLAAPVGGKFPQSYTIAPWQESMFSAITDRVRWSHPGQPEDWRTNDWIDVDPGGTTEKIQALVPFGQQLLVFKHRGIFAIVGAPPDGLELHQISKRVGTPTPHSVVATEDAVYFWDSDTGLWKYDGSELTWVFERIFPLIDDNKLNMPFSWNVRVAFHNRRVYVSVPWLAEPWGVRQMMLVFAPDVGKQGAWSVHDVSTAVLHVHRQSSGGDLRLLGASSARVMELDAENYFMDELTPGVTQIIKAWYATRWFDARNPALRKRWKRPIVVARGGANSTMFVDVLTDYDPTRVSKQFELNTELAGAELVWDVTDWDEGLWAAESGDVSVILRGSPLGTGTAKALRFHNGTADAYKGQDWRVHGLTMKWIAKRMRN